jgi:hypothetical protein
MKLPAKWLLVLQPEAGWLTDRQTDRQTDRLSDVLALKLIWRLSVCLSV